MKDDQKSHGVYSAGEMTFMKGFQKLKGIILRPFILLFSFFGISANMLSIASGATAVIALVISIVLKNPLVFVIGMWAHLIIDGFDGEMARYTGSSNLFGCYIDVLFDLLGVIATSIFIVHYGYAMPTLVLVYTSFYTILIFQGFLLNMVKEPFGFIVRPRIPMFIAITIDFIAPNNVTYWLTLVSCILLIFFCGVGFFKLGKVIKERFDKKLD